MEFELSEELKMIKRLSSDFVEGRLKPLERDILGKAADLSDARTYLPAAKETELIKEVKNMGLWGLGVPEELGGAGLNTLAVCLVEEELAKTVVPFHFGDVTPILFECNERQREKYLQPALNNKKRPLMALMENGSANLTRMKTKAEKADGDYILNGTKLSFSRTGDDFFAVVFAKAEKGFTCFLVDKGTEGFDFNDSVERNGWLSRVREPLPLSFKDCKIKTVNILGEEGKAFHLGEKWLPQRRVIRGARAVGIARRLLEEAAAQAQSAAAFGQPAYKRTSIRTALADIAADVHAARLIIYEAACMADAGKDIRRQAGVVKLYTARMLRSVTNMVAHVFNGPSVAGEPSIEKLCRYGLEVNMQEIVLEKQRSVIAGDILKGLTV